MGNVNHLPLAQRVHLQKLSRQLRSGSGCGTLVMRTERHGQAWGLPSHQSLLLKNFAIIMRKPWAGSIDPV